MAAFLCVFCTLNIILLSAVVYSSDSVNLETGKKYSRTSEIDIYCHRGIEKAISNTWRSVYLDFQKLSSDSKFFGGENTSDVLKQYVDHKTSWFSFWKFSSIQFPVFKNYCIGIYSEDAYEFQFIDIYINFWRLLQVSAGILIFFSASNLSRNILFHYAAGISFGVFASFLIIVFLISRITPKKVGAYSILIFGWSLVLYLLQLIWENIKSLVESYREFLIAYFIIIAVISSTICYYYGPVTNYKTLNLIQWSLQLIGLSIIFFSSEFREVPTVIIITIITIHVFPQKWLIRGRMLWRRWFPPKVKLLTETEYIQQANEETKKALEELRKYCRSPDCNAWKTLRKLNDPIRFAQFVEGDSHLTDQEILDYDSESLLNCAEENDRYENSSDEDTPHTSFYRNHNSL
ncbi:nuclear envelope integral membrane protein isoform X2 [Centruroides vittatus]|uniref:nuclear envelope integral membrane protein isoform X2 n=1 Tax=Centruroides vittatus TaxID=120091 RepID=UPI00350F7EEF